MDNKYSITASSKESFEYIENALNKFDEHYKINHDFGILNAKNLIDNIIQIYPIKHDKIKEIEIINGSLEGSLLKSTPEFCLIVLSKHRFSIEFTNPDFRKEGK